MEHVKEKLSEFLDRELPEAEVRLVEAHLAACAGCREALEELKAVSRLVGGLPKEPLPEGFMSRLERRRRRESEKKTPRHILPMPARALAYALSCCVVLFVTYEKFQPMVADRAGMAMLSGAPQSATEPSTPAPEDSIARESMRGAGFASLGKSFGAAQAPGAPVGEAPPPPPPRTYTNEMLHQDLEAKKSRMGIVRILPKGSQAEGGFYAEAVGARMQPRRFAAAARLEGARPALMAISGRGGGAPLAAGFVARSAEEQRRIWAARALPAEGPKADYSREMLVVVFPADAGATVEIAEVRESAYEINVTYREVALSKAASTRKASSPYQFRAVPISAKPVSFEKLP